MAGLEDLSKKMAAVAAKAQRGADKIVRKVALAIDQTVVMATPVDTGRARANWIASLDAPVLSASEATDKSGGKPLAQAQGVIGAYKGETNVSIHITNNLPYIGSLNDGSSAQAAAGFVQAGVRAGVRAVQGSRLLEG